MELVYSFLVKYFCVNGVQCNRYIREVYRVGKVLVFRFIVVKFVYLEYRDFILQKFIFLQSLGIRIVIREELSWLQCCKNF